METDIPGKKQPKEKLLFIAKMIAIGMLSYLSIRFSYQVGFATNDIVAIWPAAAISYWAVRKYGPWAMLPIFLADAIDLYIFLPHLVPAGFINSVGNAIAPWIGVLVERLWHKGEHPYLNIRSTLASILAGMGTLSVVAAIIGTTNISQLYAIPLPAAVELFWQWLLSDYTGCLVFAPVLLTITKYRFKKHDLRKTLIDQLLVLISIIGLWWSTSSGVSMDLGYYPTVFLTMPAMIWLSLRDDTARTMLGLAVLSVAAFIFTIQSIDAVGSTTWLTVQLYIVVIIFSAYIVHAMQLERTELIKTLARERDELEERVAERTFALEELATIDSLTGAYNRRTFFEMANEELKRARGKKPLSLILMDIDEFKKVNDNYGHAMGDQVLSSMTDLIQSLIRQGNDKFARMGGEEFALLVPETDLNGAVQLAERIRKNIEKLSYTILGDMDIPNVDAPREFHITCSFGVAEFNLSHGDVNRTLSIADNALYKAKNNGRNQVATFEADQTDFAHTADK
jgi:diguanylate cyclase (GGDEF)-like protein